MNVFNPKSLTNLEVLAPHIIELTFDDGSQKTFSGVMWSVNVEPDGVSGDFHLAISGGTAGIGILGERVSPTEPINLNGVAVTSIQDVEDYLIEFCQ